MLLEPRPNDSSRVKPESGETSVMLLEPRPNHVRLVKPESSRYVRDVVGAKTTSHVRLVKPESAEMSLIELLLSDRFVRLVKPESAEMSLIELLLSDKDSRLVKPESAEMSVSLLPSIASHPVNPQLCQKSQARKRRDIRNASKKQISQAG